MTIFGLARLPRTEAIAMYLRVSGLDRNSGREQLPNTAVLSRDRLAALIWEKL